MRPNVYVSAAPMRKIENSSKRLLSGVGFSFGEAEFAFTKPPPFVPIFLIHSCEAIGPLRDRLLEAFDRDHVGIRVEVLRHALPHEQQRAHDGDRKKDVEQNPGHVDPEIAQRLDGRARDAAEERDRKRDTERGRDPIMPREPRSSATGSSSCSRPNRTASSYW